VQIPLPLLLVLLVLSALLSSLTQLFSELQLLLIHAFLLLSWPSLQQLLQLVPLLLLPLLLELLLLFLMPPVLVPLLSLVLPLPVSSRYCSQQLLSNSV
jgi:hypothetical protein